MATYKVFVPGSTARLVTAGSAKQAVAYSRDTLYSEAAMYRRTGYPRIAARLEELATLPCYADYQGT